MGRLSTGIKGLDKVLYGGFLKQKAYLISGGPGAGKTTFCLHFLEEGSRKGENCLFISLGEREKQIRENAKDLGLKLKKVYFLDLSPSSDYFVNLESYDIFSPAEVEKEPVANAIKEAVESYKPKRVVIDSLTQFRYLATDVFQFRKEVLSLLRYLADNGATVVFTSEASQETPDDDLRFLSDGVIDLFVGEDYRYLVVRKFRGSEFLSGTHTYEIKTGKGVVVYPRLHFESVQPTFGNFEKLSFGVPEIDELLYGGIERSTVSIVAGPSGTGKTTLCMQFLKEASGRGERSVLYTFEEAPAKIINRCEQVNIPAKHMVEKGTLEIVYVPPNIYTADAFAEMVKEDVEKNKTQIVMIDSTSGYDEAIIGKKNLPYLFNLCKYLSLNGVTVLLPTEVKNITGDFVISNYDISYVADNILFLRYIEVKGQLRRTIGVLKKRLSNFEKTLREFEITQYGIKVGEPLRNLENILTGTPRLIDEKEQRS